jgi:hypothetical protein
MCESEAYFRALELDQTATLDEIKQSYKDLVMVWHPDRFAHNVRLRLKAEEKLKQFNQAYVGLKQWHENSRQASGATTRQPHAQGQKVRSPQAHSRPSRPPNSHTSNYSPPPHINTSGLYITFAHAEYVMGHYCFEPLKNMDASHHEYQSGPFVLMVCDDPLALTLSVPCNSLEHFDRILLSIPCKSTGHFCHAEAQALLMLLHTQAL